MIRVHNVGSSDYRVLRASDRSSGERIPRYATVLKGITLCTDVEILWSFEYIDEVDFLEGLVRRLKKVMNGLGEINLTIMHFPYLSNVSFVCCDSFVQGELLHKLVGRINDMDVDKVSVVDPKNINELFGIRNQELYSMADIVEKCEKVTDCTYGYVCFMSQYKQWKYEALGVTGKPVLTYIADKTGATPGTILGSDIYSSTDVLIIDDTCYKGTTYKAAVEMLQAHGASDVDIYVSQIAKEGLGADGIVKTGARNVITLTSKKKAKEKELQGNGNMATLYELLVGIEPDDIDESYDD